MISIVRRFTGIAALMGLAVLVPVRADAGLTLTADGIAAGFELSTYASGGNAYSFIAAAPLLNPNVNTMAVIDNEHALLRTYADVDGQTYGDALNSVSFQNAINIANAGGQTYATQFGIPGGLFSVSNSLGLTAVSVTGGFIPYYGFAGNPVTGHLLAYGNTGLGDGIYDINPISGAISLIAGGGGFDGVSVSPDGKTVYVEQGGNHIIGFDITTHSQVFSAFSNHAPDGTGVIAGGQYDGYVVSNNNDGTVSLFNPTGTTETIIASGGSRGDFTSPDTNNGTLLLSEYGFSYRLKAPGGSFGGNPVPEPTTLTMLGIGIAGMAGYGWRRRKLAANPPAA